MESQQSLVANILGQYQSPIVPASLEEEGKAQLTRKAAYEMYLVNRNIGLLKKDSGNQVMGLSVDVVMDRSDGSWADIASKIDVPGHPDLVQITAPWTGHESDMNPDWLKRWVEPSLALVNAPGPLRSAEQPIPGPIPTPTPGEAVLAVFEVTNEDGEFIEALLDAVNVPFGNWHAKTCSCCGTRVTTLAPSHYDVTVSAPGLQSEVLHLDLVKSRTIPVKLRK